MFDRCVVWWRHVWLFTYVGIELANEAGKVAVLEVSGQQELRELHRRPHDESGPFIVPRHDVIGSWPFDQIVRLGEEGGQASTSGTVAWRGLTTAVWICSTLLHFHGPLCLPGLCSSIYLNDSLYQPFRDSSLSLSLSPLSLPHPPNSTYTSWLNGNTTCMCPTSM